MGIARGRRRGQPIEEPADNGNGIYRAPRQETGYPARERVLRVDSRIREPGDQEQQKQTERTENVLGIHVKQVLYHHNLRAAHRATGVPGYVKTLGY
jgi:hypothetical protein